MGMNFPWTRTQGPKNFLKMSLRTLDRINEGGLKNVRHLRNNLSTIAIYWYYTNDNSVLSRGFQISSTESPRIFTWSWNREQLSNVHPKNVFHCVVWVMIYTVCMWVRFFKNISHKDTVKHFIHDFFFLTIMNTIVEVQFVKTLMTPFHFQTKL